ncbi:cobalamin biosynthesis protein CobD [Rhodoferax sp. 4810]|nr:cobalamin biosynthesis protein CobD [Rhodoferax jenense]
MTYALALLLALLIDRLWGEPPVRLHPVVWMGNYLGWAGKRVQRVASQTAFGQWSGQAAGAALQAAQSLPDYKAFWLAALYWIGGAALFSIAAWWLEAAVSQLGWALTGLSTVDAGAGLSDVVSSLLAAVLLALLLKPMLAWAMLKSEVLAVERALGESLQAGRERLSWLVSRDTSTLSEAQVRESAIESLAENLNDSVVAPIFWFVLLGLPGAVAYRFANTADAMWGYKGVYKGQNWEWAGKWAARVDDVLNWLPARLTGLLLVVTCGVKAGALAKEAAKTPSPNSGWPMAAMALALNIRLGKPGVYVLNPAGGAPLAVQTQQAIAYASKVLLALIPVAVTALYLRVWIVA